MVEPDPRNAGEAAPTFVLVPGAGGQGWYWHRLVAELANRRHDAVAVDLPAADHGAGLNRYADVIAGACKEHGEVVLVAQSMAGFSAPLVCTRRPVRLLVLLNAMIPRPGETAGSWWASTGQAQARAELAAHQNRAVTDEIDLREDFFHDVPEELTAEAMRHPMKQSERPFEDPFPLDQWPEVPTRVLVGQDDRFFPAAFQHRQAAARLGIPADETPGGHLVALARPAELADRLIAYLSQPEHRVGSRLPPGT